MPTYTNEELKQRAGAPLLDSSNQPISSSVQLNTDELKLDRLEQLRSKRPLSKRALPKLVLSSILLSPILLGGLWFMGGMKFPTFSSTQPDEAKKNELAMDADQKKLLDKIDEQQKQIAEAEAKLASFNQQKKESPRQRITKPALNTKTQENQPTQRRIRQPSSSVAVRQTPRVRSISQSKVAPTQRVVTQPDSRRTLSSRPVITRRPPIQPTFRPKTVPTLNSTSMVAWEPNKGVSGGAVLATTAKQARPEQNIATEIQNTQNPTEETSKIALEDSLLSERPLIKIEQGTVANGILSAGLSWDLGEEIIGQTVSVFLEEPISQDGQVIVEADTEIVAQVVKASQSGLVQLVGVKIGAVSASIPLPEGAITFLAATGKPLIAQVINNDQGGEDHRPDWLNAILAEGLAAANPRQVIRVNGGDDDILSRLLMGGAQGLVDNLTPRRKNRRDSRSTQAPLFYLEANMPVKIVFLKDVNFLSNEVAVESEEIDLEEVDLTDEDEIDLTKEDETVSQEDDLIEDHLIDFVEEETDNE
jgi:hypothetical protein